MSLLRRKLMEMKSEAPSKPNLATVTEFECDFDARASRQIVDTSLRAKVKKGVKYRIQMTYDLTVSEAKEVNYIQIGSVQFWTAFSFGKYRNIAPSTQKINIDVTEVCNRDDVTARSPYLVRVDTNGTKGHIHIYDLKITEA